MFFKYHIDVMSESHPQSLYELTPYKRVYYVLLNFQKILILVFGKERT